jgi:hypothetical protein
MNCKIHQLFSCKALKGRTLECLKQAENAIYSPSKVNDTINARKTVVCLFTAVKFM